MIVARGRIHRPRSLRRSDIATGWCRHLRELVKGREASLSVAHIMNDEGQKMIEATKDQVVRAIASLFSHGQQPLERTLDYHNDPGLLGPESVSWQVIGDASAFVGGIRALLVQTAHPEVVAGVEDHSRYRVDPLGRLTRTSAYVTETTYGAMPEVNAAVAAVRQAHRPVRGTSARGNAYSAGDPAMAAWVHNVLTDSFLAAYQSYGPLRLTIREADQFVEEQTRIGHLLGASPLPNDSRSLDRWIRDHAALEPSEAQRSSVEFLQKPPLAVPVKVGYGFLYRAAVATVPSSIAHTIGVEVGHRDAMIGRASVRALRWALGSSPSWHLALTRMGAPVPAGTFRQPLPRRNGNGKGKAAPHT